jgi:hypothetical protein
MISHVEPTVGTRTVTIFGPLLNSDGYELFTLKKNKAFEIFYIVIADSTVKLKVILLI